MCDFVVLFVVVVGGRVLSVPLSVMLMLIKADRGHGSLMPRKETFAIVPSQCLCRLISVCLTI